MYNNQALNDKGILLVGPDVVDGDGTRRSAALGAAALAGVLAAERDPALPVNGAGLRGIGGTAGRFLHRNGMAGDPSGRLNDLAVGEALPIAQIKCGGGAACFQVVQGEEMGVD